MHIDRHTKDLQKSYCKTSLAVNGELTRELADKIDAGDEATMRHVYTGQQQRIREQAQKIADPTEKAVTLTQVDSIQEVLDALPDILKA